MYEHEKQKLKNILGGQYKILKMNNCIIAGGMIASLFTNKQVNDIDVYFRSKQEMKEAILDLNEYHGCISFMTEKSIVFGKCDEMPTQLVLIDEFKDAYDIFDKFDYTVCMGAYDFKTEEFILHDKFLLDNASRSLNFHQGTLFPIISALRIDKYKQKGYSISKKQFIKVMLTIAKMQLNSWEDVKPHIAGMYGQSQIELDTSKEFSFDELINQIENNKEVDSIDSENHKDVSLGDVIKALNLPTKYMKFNDKYFIETIDGCGFGLEETIEVEDSPPENGIEVKFSDVIGDEPLFYKFVRKTNGKLQSVSPIFGKSIQYNVGEVVKSPSPYIYCVPKKDIKKAKYMNKKDTVLVEIKANDIDITTHWNTSNVDTWRVVEGVVIREVPEEEWKEWIDADPSNGSVLGGGCVDHRPNRS